MTEIRLLRDDRSTGAGIALLAGLLALALWSLPLPDIARWLGLGTFLGIGALVLTRLRPFHPHARFGPANQITLIRAAGASLLMALAAAAPLTEAMLWTAFGLSLALILLDGLDGWLARRTGLASAFGARFDMEVDALTILAQALLVWQNGQIGPWILALGLMRYAFVLASWLWPRLAAPLPPSFRRKTICVVQLLVLTACLTPLATPPLTAALAGCALIALAWSFLIDLRWLLR